jgi:hypothetical protein
MNYRFNFGHFEPDHDLEVASCIALDEILDCAPSDSVPVARLIKRRDGFEATVEIFSKAGYFVGRAFENTPEHAIESVKNRIEKRLSQWRKARFIERQDNLEEDLIVPSSKSGGTYEKQAH